MTLTRPERTEFSENTPLHPLPSNNIVTHQFLEEHPNAVFVFGDNLLRKGTGGAAKLRHHPQSYGFITKKAPLYNLAVYYTPEEYLPVFLDEVEKLKNYIDINLDKVFYISPVGGGLANHFKIFEQIVAPRLKQLLSHYNNIVFLW